MLLQFIDVLSSALLTQLAAQGEALSTHTPIALRVGGEALVASLQAHPLFMLGVQPRAWSQPRLRRAAPEGVALDAVDALVEGIRTDVAVCVMLSAPSDYEGGELLVDTGFGVEAYKPKAGSCLAYPAGARTTIAPVSRGTRHSVELWTQSAIRSSAQRAILYDLGSASRLLEVQGGGADPDVVALKGFEQKLLRMWGEP